MKTWIKNLLITAAVLSAAGLILSGIGLILGGVQGVKNMQWSITPPEASELAAKEEKYEIPMDGIRELEISWASGTVEVQPWDGKTLVLEEHCREGLTEKTRLNYRIERDTVTVDFLGKKHWFGISALEGKDLKVLVPKDFAGELEIEAVSADLAVRDLKLDQLSLDTVSGRVTVENTEARELEGDSVSGRLDLKLPVCPAQVDLESVSGEIRLALPENSDFHLNWETVSGSKDTQIRENPQARSRVDLETVSGNMEIRILEVPEVLPDETTGASPDVGTGATE